MSSIVVLAVVLLGTVRATTKDSYLEAYEESHGATPKADREYSEPYPYPAGPSGPGYGPPKYTYGPPQNYGPPVVPVYGPPSAPAPVYGVPHGMLGLLDKLKLKLDLFTVGKILLKIVLFKKFVSFVAIICLLLFIPTLKKKVDEAVPDGGDDDEEGDMRQGGDYFLNNLTEFVVGAIDSFSKNYTEAEPCEDVFCMTKKVLHGIDNKLSYRRLAELRETQ